MLITPGAGAGRGAREAPSRRAPQGRPVILAKPLPARATGRATPSGPRCLRVATLHQGDPVRRFRRVVATTGGSDAHRGSTPGQSWPATDVSAVSPRRRRPCPSAPVSAPAVRQKLDGEADHAVDHTRFETMESRSPPAEDPARPRRGQRADRLGVAALPTAREYSSRPRREGASAVRSPRGGTAQRRTSPPTADVRSLHGNQRPGRLPEPLPRRIRSR